MLVGEVSKLADNSYYCHTNFESLHDVTKWLRPLPVFEKIPPVFLKEFKVSRHRNGRGDSHLLVITEEAIPDIAIGTVVIVPYAEGFNDPVKVLLQVDDKGCPLVINEKFAIVSKYIYE